VAATVKIAILANASKAKVVISKTGKALASLGKATAPLASIASLSGPAVAGVLALTKAVVAAGKAAAAAAPLLAFAPGLVGGFLLLKTTLTTVGKAMGEALEPVRLAFERTNLAVSALAKQGLPALGREFVKVNMPAIDGAMRRIAVSANRTVREIGKWVNSSAGMKLIRETSDGTAAAFEKAAPHISKAVIALGNMAGRADIAGLMERLGTAVGRVADKFSGWADSVSSSDIKGALDKVSKATESVREKLAALREIIGWLAENQDKVKAFSNALAIIGIAIGIWTGGWIAVAIGAFTLLLNNFDLAKKGLGALSDTWSRIWQGITTNAAFLALKQAVTELFQAVQAEAGPLLETLKRDLGPAFSEVKRVIEKDLLPAVTRFVKAVTPIVAWMVRTFGPVVSAAFKGVVLIIGAVLKVISGILNVFSALLTGNWRALWTGVKQIASGAWRAVGAVFSAAKTTILTIVRSIGSGIKAAFSGAGKWLVSAGRAIVEGLWSGISGLSGWLAGKVTSFIARTVPGPIRGALGINSPSKVAKEIGGYFGQGLGIGLDGTQSRVRRAAANLATAAVARPAGGRSVGGGVATPGAGGTLRLVSDGGSNSVGALLVAILEEESRKRGGLKVRLA
jgi:hypothetical protein